MNTGNNQKRKAKSCPGCKSTITVTGAGFDAKEEVKHTCEACGSGSVFCCATKHAAPSTEGMEKK